MPMLQFYCEEPYCLAVSPDGSRIAVRDRSKDNEIEILDVRTLKTLAILQNVQQDISGPNSGVTFSADGHLLAASNWSNRILVWDVPAVDDASQPAQVPSPVLTLPVYAQGAMRFSPDGRRLTLYARNEVKTWDVTARDTSLHRDWTLGGVLGGRFNNDGSRAALLTDPNSFYRATVVRIWDVTGEREICRFQDSRENRSLAFPVFSPDGQRVAVTSRDARFATPYARRLHPDQRREPIELLILDASTGKVTRTIRPAEATEIHSPVFHPDGTRVAARVERSESSQEATFQVVVWKVVTGRKLIGINIAHSSPRLVGFSPDGKEFLIARSKGDVTFHDTTTGEPRRTVAAEGTKLNSVGAWSQSPNGKLPAVFGVQGREHEIAAEIHDAATGELRLRFPVQTEHPPVAMTWSPDGSRVALLSSKWLGAEITIWDTKTGRPLLTLNRKGLVSSNSKPLLFSPDNHRLLHIADDNQVRPTVHPIRIWDAMPLPED